MVRIIASVVPETPARFQWGHDPEVMVRVREMVNQDKVVKMFQWGHDPEVMVRELTTSALPNPIERFNGATTRRSW